jgi:hypothetical protein
LRAKEKSKSKPLRRSVFAVKRKQVKANLCGKKKRNKVKPLRRSVFAVKRKEIKSNLCDLASLR